MGGVLKNETRNSVLAERPRIASSFFQRAKGLLGKKDMEEDEALYIPKCQSIHTFFMRFNIDVIFVDEDGTALKIVKNLKPYRMAYGPRKTTGVWELQASEVNRINPGDIIRIN